MRDTATTQTDVQNEAARNDRGRRRLRTTLYYGGFAVTVANLLILQPLNVVSREVSLWLLYTALALMLAAFFVWVMGVASFIRRWRRHATGRCPHCGYDLRESVGRCPECGLELRFVRSFGRYAAFGG